MKNLINIIFIILTLISFGQSNDFYDDIDNEIIGRELAIKRIKEGKIYCLIPSYGDHFLPTTSFCALKVKKQLGVEFYLVKEIMTPRLADSIWIYNTIIADHLENKIKDEGQIKLSEFYNDCLEDMPCHNSYETYDYLTGRPNIYFSKNEYELTSEAKCIIDSIYFPILKGLEQSIFYELYITGHSDNLEFKLDTSIAQKRVVGCKKYLLLKGIKEDLISTGIFDKKITYWRHTELTEKERKKERHVSFTFISAIR